MIGTKHPAQSYCHNMNIHTFLVFIGLLLALVLATGCGKKDDAEVVTQVAARVNADEITVHQVNDVLARSQNITPEVAAHAKSEILNRLIDQQLAKQKAIENKLDRTPKVILAIEAAKNEILARAYQEHITASLDRPAPVEIHEYYIQHPELFAQRQVFNLEELTFVASSEVATGLRKLLSNARSMQEIADWLQSRGVKFAANRGVRSAEQIPLEILPKVRAMKAGQVLLLEFGSGRFQVIRLEASKAVPVDEATATPRIQQFLSNRNSSEVMAKEMNRIKERAKIEYLGEFAGATAGAETKPKPEAEAQPKSEESPKEPSQK